MAKRQTPATDFPNQTDRPMKNETPGKPPRVRLVRNIGSPATYHAGQTFRSAQDAEKAGAKPGDYTPLQE